MESHSVIDNFMRHPSPAARAIRNNPAPTTTAPVARAKVHDPDDQEDRHQTGTAVAAVEAEAQAVSPGRAGVGRQRAAAPWRLPAVSEVTRLPRGELEGAGDQDDHTDRDRYGARQRR